MKMIRAAAAAFAASLALGAQAQAASILLDVGKQDRPRTVTIAGLGQASAAPIQFKALMDGKSVNLLAWCVDVYHHITLKDYAPDLRYVDTQELTTDFNGRPLDAGDPYRVGLLANYGQHLFDTPPVAPAAFTQTAPKRSQFPSGAAGTTAYNKALADFNAAKAAHSKATADYNAAVADRYLRLSAVQSAIWQVTSNRDVTSGDAAYDALVDQLSLSPANAFGPDYASRDAGFDLITPVQLFGGSKGTTPLPLTQSFVFATGAVPEPSAWALMIVGVGLAGAALRRRNTAAAATAEV